MTCLDEDFRKSLIRFTEASRTLFSNPQKVEREKMVCRAFLRCIGVRFSEEEISKGACEPVDIAFRGASFQISEVLDQGRRRGDELCASARKFGRDSRADDVLEPWKGSLPVSFNDVAALVADRLCTKSAALGGSRGCYGIDALVYVNLRGHHLVSNGISDDNRELVVVRQQGWRSVSIAMIPYGIVWFAADDCPSFLTEVEGRILSDGERTDGWFEPEAQPFAKGGRLGA